MYYLDLLQNPAFSECEYRRFGQGEHHITRKWEKSVLLLMLKMSCILKRTEKQSPLRKTLGISSEAVCSRKARRVPLRRNIFIFILTVCLKKRPICELFQKE